MIRTDTWLREHADLLGINHEFINPASVDVCLGAEIIRFKYEPHLGGGADKVIFHLNPDEEFQFEPGYFYLAHTEEHTTLPDDHCAQLILKSSSGRKGLDHAHSGWGDPSFSGQWTFEFVAHKPVVFKRGQRIAQLVFMKCDGVPEKTYAVTGNYQGQTGVTEAK